MVEAVLAAALTQGFIHPSPQGPLCSLWPGRQGWVLCVSETGRASPQAARAVPGGLQEGWPSGQSWVPWEPGGASAALSPPPAPPRCGRLWGRGQATDCGRACPFEVPAAIRHRKSGVIY